MVIVRWFTSDGKFHQEEYLDPRDADERFRGLLNNPVVGAAWTVVMMPIEC